MAARVDRNRSTFSLEHDSRPQDLQPLQQGYQQPLTTDFRFKGYPSENFFKYKEPQYKRMSASYDQPETNRYFGKSQHFDTGRAKTERPSANRRAQMPSPRPLSERVKKPINPVATKPTEHDPVTTYRGQLVEEARPKVEDGPRGPPYGTGDPSMDDQQAARPGPMRGLGYDNSMEMERERNRREAEDADLDIIRARKQEELRQMERVEERRRKYEDMRTQQNQDMEMLKNYNPWGRPGGGAPKTGSFDEKTDNRKQRFTEHQLTPRNNDLSYKDNWEPAFPDIENEFNRLSNKTGQEDTKPPESDNNGYNPSGPGDRTRYDGNGHDKGVPSSHSNSKSHVDTKEDKINREKRAKSNTIFPPHTRFYGSIVDKLGSPGGGAPLRTNSGRLKTMVPGDTLIRFREQSRPTIENHIRYHKTPEFKRQYAHDLDMQRKREELREQDHKLEQLKSELEYLKSSAREPEMGYPNQDSFAARNNVYGDQRGRGKSHTAPESSRSSNIQHQIDEYDDVGRIGKPKKPNRFQPQIYYPFNKPGGGAPILDQHGKIMTSLQSRSELTDDQKRQEAIRAKLYHRDLDVQYQNEMRKKREDKEELSKPHGELAVLMDRGRVGKPRKNSRTGLLENHHLAQSDVVKLKIGEPQSDRGKQSQYNADLGYLVSEKNKKSELNKLKENQEGLKHLHTMDQTFGRLGGGAPKGYTLQKLNLDRIINHPTKEEASMEYVKSKDWSEVEPDKFFKYDEEDYYNQRSIPPKNPLNSWREDYDGRLSPRQKPGKYIRSTVTSNHANQYDYRYDYPKKDYTLDAPYATSGERARLM